MEYTYLDHALIFTSIILNLMFLYYFYIYEARVYDFKKEIEYYEETTEYLTEKLQKLSKVDKSDEKA